MGQVPVAQLGGNDPVSGLSALGDMEWNKASAAYSSSAKRVYFNCQDNRDKLVIFSATSDSSDAIRPVIATYSNGVLTYLFTGTDDPPNVTVDVRSETNVYFQWTVTLKDNVYSPTAYYAYLD